MNELIDTFKYITISAVIITTVPFGTMIVKFVKLMLCITNLIYMKTFQI